MDRRCRRCRDEFGMTYLLGEGEYACPLHEELGHAALWAAVWNAEDFGRQDAMTYLAGGSEAPEINLP